MFTSPFEELRSLVGDSLSVHQEGRGHHLLVDAKSQLPILVVSPHEQFVLVVQKRAMGIACHQNVT